MPIDISFVSAFLVGLLGGVHCIGMCGGIVSVLSIGLADEDRASGAIWQYALAYNIARILSYSVAGMLMGGIGWLVVYWPDIRQLQLVLQILSGLFMISMGLYLAGWWFGLLKLEGLGAGVWKRIEPYTRRFIPVRSLHQAFFLGLLWGWLPCGLVYSVLVWSIATASPLMGGLLMLAFGLGTLPLMISMGAMAGRFSNQWIRSQAARRMAGSLVILLGIYQLMRAVTA
ncbi:MAG: sulfite exporter TauE/SafE family protein [Gammaproteobacteria bacterium]